MAEQTPNQARVTAQAILNDLQAGANIPGDAGTTLYATAGVVSALLYIGDQLATTNRKLDYIETALRTISNRR